MPLRRDAVEKPHASLQVYLKLMNRSAFQKGFQHRFLQHRLVPPSDKIQNRPITPILTLMSSPFHLSQYNVLSLSLTNPEAYLNTVKVLAYFIRSAHCFQPVFSK